MSSSLGEYWQPYGLTWQGHDYVEVVRNDTTYNRAVKTLKEKGSVLSFELIKATLIGFGKAHIPMP